MEAVSQALAAQPGADPWLQDMLAGENAITAAWKARGNGWASSVSEEGWQGFADGLVKARQHLTKAWKLHPHYPEAPTRMIQVVMGEDDSSGETVRLWFDRAVSGQLDYMPAYDQLVWALLPRWGGSLEEVYDFGVECLATKRFDTDVPLRYYNAVWQLANREGDIAIWRRPGVYSKMQQIFQSVYRK
jgi:hypothetical protein